MKTKVVILAAGKGRRMNSDIPKVLLLINERPLLSYLVSSVKESGVDLSPVIVVSPENREIIQSTLNYTGPVAVQLEQKGTGSAVLAAQDFLGCDNVIVLYGDHPFISANTIKSLLALHIKEGSLLTLLTILVDDFNEWRAPFSSFGKIVRSEDGRIERIIEVKDATAEQLLIKEVNPAIFCFNREWLIENLPKIKNENTQGEFYLTDLVGMAMKQGVKIASMTSNPMESIGINTKEHLEIARFLAK
ncbi:MAG: hypothetical protein COU06_02925 [Candidatus Harrisonbacteria bacterium CG10_big_fil_rev_8_21_14_0_10_38_8]|uniref:MobA-like NTP transferase domain-containing protein n=1 Tax=Candidatus Harrisonbacteria bacterium CG10_big_fil_rev_8_21_14_0_10_38_8 TaxID=1974582 RepID=A0A2M6WJG6_9BACT|nr:MAG: hypothetical protein COU06_02925 [Candidatus Harrisonbacteria bacterium CG10_big_fil_rev_8_21_14_0_10_38_8]